jgi:hypothetical protein
MRGGKEQELKKDLTMTTPFQKGITKKKRKKA